MRLMFTPCVGMLAATMMLMLATPAQAIEVKPFGDITAAGTQIFIIDSLTDPVAPEVATLPSDALAGAGNSFISADARMTSVTALMINDDSAGAASRPGGGGGSVTAGDGGSAGAPTPLPC